MINSVKTDRSLRYRVYHENGELVGRTFYIEDAAVLVGLCGTGATIKVAQTTVWTQGVDGDARASFEQVVKPAKLRMYGYAVDKTIATALEAKQDVQKTIAEAATKLAKDSAFDFSCATNLYLVAARELGTELYGTSLTDLLVDHTDWDRVKCKRLAKRVLDDPALVKLLDDEGISKWINANA